MQKMRFRKKRYLLRRIVVLFILLLGLYYGSFYIKFGDNAVKILENYYVKVEPQKNLDMSMLPIPALKEEKEEEPIIYIYNTHQTEKYEREKLQSYNIDYTVEHAALMLEYYLENKGLYAYVERENIANLLKINNYQYYQSYLASRSLMEKRKEEIKTLQYFIDVHRDAIDYNLSVCDYEGKRYAKILLVIGLEHDNYKANLEFAGQIDGVLKELNPCISRGIMQKKGAGVDGIYNQDLSPKAVLIEVGSVYNYFEEVNNSLAVLANALERVIK